MYGVAESIRSRERIQDVLRDVVKLIPPGWLYPEITRARVRIGNTVCVSDDFRETAWSLTALITVGSEHVGTVEVFYTEPRAVLCEGPFMEEERKLINGIASVLGDFVERTQADAESQRLLRIIDATPDLVAIADADGMATYLNPAGRQMLGVVCPEVSHIHIEDCHPDWVNVVLRENAFPDAVRDGSWSGEAASLRHDGSEMPVSLVMMSHTGTDGHLEFSTVMRDITDIKLAEAELADSRDAAELANRSKSEFLANMSHEIRTPLTAILGFAEMLQIDGDLTKAPPKRLEAIQTIRRNGDHLLQIINDILDLSKMEAGRIKISTEPCNIQTIVAGAMDSFRSLAKPGVELVVDCPSATVESSPVRLRQILLNLIGNAVKFTEHGSVKVSARACYGRLTIDIDDTGPGMEPAQAAGLFVPFSQLDSSATRKHDGTGLGLAISRRLAAAMGGGVEIVRAEPGKGCTFRLTLPASAAVTAKAPEAELNELNHDLRVLVVEDRPDNQELLVTMLAAIGINGVDLAENGELGIQLIATGNVYDVILMDMQMPVMDGYTATRMLRDAGYDIPIVAVTASALEGDAQRCTDAGCDGYLAKPVSTTTLTAAIARVVRIAEMVA